MQMKIETILYSDSTSNVDMLPEDARPTRFGHMMRQRNAVFRSQVLLVEIPRICVGCTFDTSLLGTDWLYIY